MVAHYIGTAKPRARAASAAELEDQSYVPTHAKTRTEFDELLRSMNLPTEPPAP